MLKGTIQFFEDDFMRTLFPMETNLLIIKSAAADVANHISDILEGRQAFLGQTRVHAAKPDFHFRRTFKLDVVAELFLYDLVYRNRQSFRTTETATRRAFGYHFREGTLTSSSLAFEAFRAAVRTASLTYEFGVSFDVSAYFNSIYAHDLFVWFNDGSRSEKDVEALHKFLRQINAGRSIDCLPQGIAPAKIIGSHFLSFIEFSARIKSPLLLRFMDDVVLFAADQDAIIQDFYQIQRLLGERGLSVNPAKTKIGDIDQLDVRKQIDEIKKQLLRVRRLRSLFDYDEESEEDSGEEESLNQRQKDYLIALLRDPQIDEEDAELVLSLLRDKSEDVLEYVPSFLEKFPNLAKNIYMFCGHVQNKAKLAEVVLHFLSSAKVITEYQLFWLAWVAESYLSKCPTYGQLIMRLYEHPSASVVSKAKVLEIPDKRFGMNDLREEHLRIGKSDWLAWASAIGLRCEGKANRNHLLNYFANAGPLNRLIADCAKAL